MVLFLLAWSHYKDGDIEKALPLAKQALDLSPKTNHEKIASMLKKIEEAQKELIKDSEARGS